MQIIGDIFNIVLFLTVVGGAFSLLSLLANRVLRFTLPLWFSVCGMAAYIVPVLAPGLYLVPPEAHSWIDVYYPMCTVWFCGTIFFVLYDIVKTALAHRGLRGYRVCDDERINAVYARCVQLVGLKKTPPVYFGTLDDPACVVGALYPAIILNESIMKQLTDAELMTVLSHEATHIKRGHLILGRVYDYICILHWFNPFAWIAKKDFDVHCEIDCDQNALAALENKITDAGYANAMLHLYGLSAISSSSTGGGMSALGFLVAKRRIELVMSRPSKAKRIVVAAILAVMLAMVITFSMSISRGYYYPYPAYGTGLEYSDIGA